MGSKFICPSASQTRRLRVLGGIQVWCPSRNPKAWGRNPSFPKGISHFLNLLQEDCSKVLFFPFEYHAFARRFRDTMILKLCEKVR